MVVRIDIRNDFTDTMYEVVKAQEMGGYQWLFDKKVERDKVGEVVEMLKNKYPNHQICEFVI